MDVVELLTKSALFSRLSEPAIYRLSELVQLSQFNPGDWVIQEGHASLGCYIIISGEVEVLKTAPEKPQRLIARLGPGEIVGEMGVIDEHPYAASVRATKETHCLMIERWDFKAQMQAYPEIALQLLPVLARRLRAMLENE